MVLVNDTNMSVSILKRDRSILSVKPNSHIFIDKALFDKVPSFIKVYTDEEFNKINKEDKKEIEEKVEKKIEIKKPKKISRRSRRNKKPTNEETSIEDTIEDPIEDKKEELVKEDK